MENENYESLPVYYQPFLPYRKTAKERIFMGGRETEPLNGLWHYAVDQYHTCLRSQWYLDRREDENGSCLPLDYSFDEWPEIQLPCCWNLTKPELFLYESAMIFTRTFLYQRRKSERTYLRIGAANYLCVVFINGKAATAITELSSVSMHRARRNTFRWITQIGSTMEVFIAILSSSGCRCMP